MADKKQVVMHLCPLDKFIPQFIDTIRTNFRLEDHRFVLYGVSNRYEYEKGDDVVEIDGSLRSLAMLLAAPYKADKVIVHGLISFKLVLLLFFQPWLLKKCYWVIWGIDLYVRELGERNWRWYIREFVRGHVIRRIGHLVTITDVELVRQWYGAKGEHHECLMYPSNTYQEIQLQEVGHDFTSMLVGNSADPSNNHFEIFTILKALQDQTFRITCPLSYGDLEYAKKVAAEGYELFGGRFTPLLDFLPIQDYIKILAQIDIAVFAHKRQQALGNVVSLLGLGKKVYMRSDVTSYRLFDEMGIRVFDINLIDLSPLDEHTRISNITLIKDRFSVDVLIRQLKSMWAN